MLNTLVNDDTIEWLLEKENPSVRFFTQTKLIGLLGSDPEVTETRRDIMKVGIVPEILNRQHEEGYWGLPEKFYTDKYKGTVWQLMFLAELGANGKNDRIRKAVEFILENSQEPESGGFSYRTSEKVGGGIRSGVVPCLTGNMVWSMIQLGYMDDSRVKRGIDWICKYQRSDDGIHNPPKGWPYDRYEMCWGKHTCHMGVVKALKALAAIPEEKRPEAAHDKIRSLSEYILIHHVYKKSHALDEISRPGWLKPGFPLMYQTDILEILEILTDLGYHDPRMQDAVEIIRKKQNVDKRWKLENSFNGRMLENIELKGKNSKWITIKALYVLKNQLSETV